MKYFWFCANNANTNCEKMRKTVCSSFAKYVLKFATKKRENYANFGQKIWSFHGNPTHRFYYFRECSKLNKKFSKFR